MHRIPPRVLHFSAFIIFVLKSTKKKGVRLASDATQQFRDYSIIICAATNRGRLLFEGGSYYFPHPLNDSITPVLCSREYLFSHFYEGLQ